MDYADVAFSAVIFLYTMLGVVLSVARVLILSLVFSAGLSRKFARNQGMVPHSKVNSSISIKDVIAALEREPQMSKTTLIYRLYEKARANVVAK